MNAGRRSSTDRMERAARSVARHGPDAALFIADAIVAAALDAEVDRLNAARGPRPVSTTGDAQRAGTPRTAVRP